MITQIVVLWMAYQFAFPTWTKVLLIFGLAINLISFGYRFCQNLSQ